MKKEDYEKIVRENVKIEIFRNIEKKAARATFEATISFSDKKHNFFFELWHKEMFYKMYEGSQRAFFAEQVFTEALKEMRQDGRIKVDYILTEEANEKINQLFIEIVCEGLLNSEAYAQKKKENPNFQL